MRYRVQWKHELVQTWTGVVEADSEEQAIMKIHEGDFADEEIIAEDGIRVYGEEAQEEDEESED